MPAPTICTTDQPIFPGLGITLAEKVALSIATLRYYQDIADERSPDGYWGAFSGGKDSCAIKHLATVAGIRVQWHYSVTTIDPPEIVHFIRSQHPDVSFDRPRRSLWSMVADRGLPTRHVRWCCQEFKESKHGGDVAIVGVRAAESPRRAGRWQTLNRWHSGYVVAPILHWTDADVWEYMRANDVPVCELYAEGWKRLGCVGCPFSHQLAEFARWPGYERQWRQAAQRRWDRQKAAGTDARHLRVFHSADEWFDWWKSGESMPGDPTDEDDSQPCLGLV